MPHLIRRLNKTINPTTMRPMKILRSSGLPSSCKSIISTCSAPILNQRDTDLVPIMIIQSIGIHKAIDVMGRNLRSLKKSHRIDEIKMNKAVCLAILNIVLAAIYRIINPRRYIFHNVLINASKISTPCYKIPKYEYNYSSCHAFVYKLNMYDVLLIGESMTFLSVVSA